MKPILLSIFGLFLFNGVFKVKANEKPNIIFIYADDLGRGLLSIYGQKFIQTPNIDRIATEGMRFDNAYGCMLCAPARASLLTGMHDCHSNEWNVTPGGIYKELDKSLSMEEIRSKINRVAKPAGKDEVFLGQVAQQAGYVTAEFGKLEWGFASTADQMERHGWDYHFGYYDHNRCHGFYPPFLFENGKKIDIPGNTRDDCGKTGEPENPEVYRQRWDSSGKAVYSENIIMDKLLRFMQDNNPRETQKPFFIFFPSQLPHGPVAIPEVHPDFKNNSELSEIEKEYASMVKMLDDDVGRIMKKLEEMGIADNTILIFSADNGHEIYYAQKDRCSKNTSKGIHGEIYDNLTTKFYSELNGDIFDGNHGMAGIKRSNWEGGVRVPLFWYWKGKIARGSVSEKMVSNYDLLNTLAEITGGKQICSKDGISYAPVLFGQNAKLRDYTVFGSYMGPALVTHDGWKLRYYIEKEVFQLYCLPEDYKEQNDLAGKYPQKVDALKKILLKECDGDFRNGLTGWKNFVSY